MTPFPSGRAILLCLTLVGCGDRATLPLAAGVGPNPVLPAPNPTLIPTINYAPAASWPAGVTPVAATGLRVQALAAGLDHPRWLCVLPNGDVLVAETNGPERPQDASGIRGAVQTALMAGAGAGGKSADRITLLRKGAQGVERHVFLAGLHSPFGMALLGDALYVADTDALVRVPYHAGETAITQAPVTVTPLPAGPINHHWTKNVIASPDGRSLYVSVGSNSNVGENGLPAERERAAIWQVDPATGAHRIFATGLRNPVGMGWAPRSGTPETRTPENPVTTGNVLWTAVNERDEIGSDLVPDYMTSVQDGAFYGWPFSYYGQHVDIRAQPQDPAMVARAIPPDYALGPHTASLGLAFGHGGAFVGQHGSWNRVPRSGYKVVFIPFRKGRPSGPPQDVLTGFVNAAGQAQGRPVGVAIERDGSLLVADDVGGVVWEVSGF